MGADRKDGPSGYEFARTENLSPLHSTGVPLVARGTLWLRKAKTREEEEVGDSGRDFCPTYEGSKNFYDSIFSVS